MASRPVGTGLAGQEYLPTRPVLTVRYSERLVVTAAGVKCCSSGLNVCGQLGILGPSLPRGSSCLSAKFLQTVNSMFKFLATGKPVAQRWHTPWMSSGTCIPPGLCLGLKLHPEFTLKIRGTLTASLSPGMGRLRKPIPPTIPLPPALAGVWMNRWFLGACMSPVASRRVHPSS